MGDKKASFIELANQAGLLSVSERYMSSDGFFVNTGSPALNSVLGSEEYGIPSGKIIELYGDNSVGKSALAYWLLGTYISIGGTAILADVARDYSEEWGATCGIDNSKLLLLHLDDKKDKSGEVVLESMETLFDKMASTISLLKAEAPDSPALLVWDDVAITPTRKELEGEFGSDAPALLASALSKGLKKLYAHMHNSPATLLCINQVRTRIGWASYDDSSGGKALKFYSSIRAKVKRREKGSTKGGARISGLVENVKNKISVPFKSATFSITTKSGVIIK